MDCSICEIISSLIVSKNKYLNFYEAKAFGIYLFIASANIKWNETLQI